MRYIAAILFALCLMASAPASAQSVEDFVTIPIGGVYTLQTSWVVDYDSVCFFEEGNPTNEFGCVNVSMPDLHPVDGIPYCELQITIMNGGIDVPVLAYALDPSGNRSSDSPNRAIVDFTPPVAPTQLQRTNNP